MTNGRYTYILKKDLGSLCREYVRAESDIKSVPQGTPDSLFIAEAMNSIKRALSVVISLSSTDVVI